MPAVLHSTNAGLSHTTAVPQGAAGSNTAVPQVGVRNIDTGSAPAVEAANARAIYWGRLCSSRKAAGEGVTLKVPDIRRGFAHGRCRVEVSLRAVTVFAPELHRYLGQRTVRGRLEVAGQRVDGGLKQEDQERCLC